MFMYILLVKIYRAWVDNPMVGRGYGLIHVEECRRRKATKHGPAVACLACLDCRPNENFLGKMTNIVEFGVPALETCDKQELLQRFD